MNHFIESYENGYIAVHSGSRHLGVQVAKYYQDLAVRKMKNKAQLDLSGIAPELREQVLLEHKANTPKISEGLAYLEGQDMEDYLNDMEWTQMYAQWNRGHILLAIRLAFKAAVKDSIESVHNYIDPETRILRKGSISAQAGEKILIPLNMKEGMILGHGRGNPDWNYSAPHGAGRLYSRSAAKRTFSLEDFQETMKNIKSTTINQDTIDEAPFAYKDMNEIIEAIKDTANILQILKPVYNFKASE